MLQGSKLMTWGCKKNSQVCKYCNFLGVMISQLWTYKVTSQWMLNNVLQKDGNHSLSTQTLHACSAWWWRGDDLGLFCTHRTWMLCSHWVLPRARQLKKYSAGKNIPGNPIKSGTEWFKKGNAKQWNFRAQPHWKTVLEVLCINK